MRQARLLPIGLAAVVIAAGCDERDSAPSVRPQVPSTASGGAPGVSPAPAIATVGRVQAPGTAPTPGDAPPPAEELRDAPAPVPGEDLESRAYRAGVVFDGRGALPDFSATAPVPAQARGRRGPSLAPARPAPPRSLDLPVPPPIGPASTSASGASDSVASWSSAARAAGKVYSPPAVPGAESAPGAAASPFQEGWRKLQDAAVAPVVYVLSRAGWGAGPPSRGIETDREAEHIVVHNTEGHDPAQLADSIAEVRGIQDFHKHGRGWSDIGYHYLIDGGGRPFQGRPEGELGAHTLNHNAGNIGIALMGNFDETVPTGPQVLGLIRLATTVAVRDGMDVKDPDFIKGHRDYNSTSCPGGNLYRMLPQIRAIVGRKVLEERNRGMKPRIDLVTALNDSPAGAGAF